MENNILATLTSEDRQEIKNALKQIIINQIEKDFDDSATYIFNPNELEDMMSEAIEEVKEEIKPMLKEFMFKQMQEKLKM